MRALATVAVLGWLVGGAATAGAQTAAPASTEMSEGRARMLMMEACNNVSTLRKNEQGMWYGNCSKGDMMVNAEGKVVPAQR